MTRKTGCKPTLPTRGGLSGCTPTPQTRARRASPPNGGCAAIERRNAPQRTWRPSTGGTLERKRPAVSPQRQHLLDIHDVKSQITHQNGCCGSSGPLVSHPCSCARALSFGCDDLRRGVPQCHQNAGLRRLMGRRRRPRTLSQLLVALDGLGRQGLARFVTHAAAPPCCDNVRYCAGCAATEVAHAEIAWLSVIQPKVNWDGRNLIVVWDRWDLRSRRQSRCLRPPLGGSIWRRP